MRRLEFEIINKIFSDQNLCFRITGMSALGVSTMSFAVDRREGVWNRYMVAGVKYYEMLIAEYSMQLIIMSLQNINAMFIPIWLYGIKSVGSLISLFILLLSNGIVSTSLGYVIALSCDNFQTIGNLINGLLLIGTLMVGK